MIHGFDWEHVKTGKRYRIVDVAIEESTLIPVVVYRCTTSGAVWTRPVVEFFDGRFRDTRSGAA
jgi:hypothetical protein